MKINGPGESPLLLLDVIKILDANDIRYAVVGAFAASYYGVVRASLDVDVVISVNDQDESVENLLSALKKTALKVTRRRGDHSDPIRCVINIEDKFQNRVDLLIGIRGQEPDIYDRTATADFMGRDIHIIGLEDFIAMKIYAGNAQDFQDAAGALQISQQQINLPLLKKLTLRYGKRAQGHLEKLLNA